MVAIVRSLGCIAFVQTDFVAFQLILVCRVWSGSAGETETTVVTGFMLQCPIPVLLRYPMLIYLLLGVSLKINTSNGHEASQSAQAVYSTWWLLHCRRHRTSIKEEALRRYSERRTRFCPITSHSDMQLQLPLPILLTPSASAKLCNTWWR
jgi:hypothetical protein